MSEKTSFAFWQNLLFSFAILLGIRLLYPYGIVVTKMLLRSCLYFLANIESICSKRNILKRLL
jgi:hypothetical protein